jgi:hypothetical protein
MGDNPFHNLGGLTLSSEQVTDLAPLQKKSSTKPRKRNGNVKAKFVMFPYGLALEAAGRLGEPAFAVLIELAHRRFRRHQNPVLLANEALATAGISRWAKNRALKRLEALGLVKVTWRQRRSPLVEILF